MIAAYQRISRADGDLGKDGKDKSNSIENQKELIQRYISCKESLQNVPVMDFVDDGYTGSNFDRPGFQQMMDGVRNGKIDTIIVKDLSRFGRDYIGVGEYMEQIFPLLGVRLIAINDNYDSNNYKGTTLGMDVVVSNLVNTMYCRDAGKKLRTANQVKWRKGITTASAAPFGYQFDPDKKGAFIIDLPAAKIVRRIVVIQQGTLKGFVGIHPNWSGINAESIRSLCLNAYLPEEVVELNDMTEMRSGKKSDMVLLSDYLTVSGTCFINQSSPVITISKNGIRFSKACHTRLDDCEYVELLYHPILQVVILRKSNHDFSTAMHWREDNDVHSAFSARAFSGLVFQTLNWRRNCRYQCRGICRGQGNAKFLIFELDESRILTGKNQYEQAEECSINLKCRLYRSKWLQSITVSDVMESGQVVENPMIGAIPSRNEVQRELDDLLMSM